MFLSNILIFLIIPLGVFFLVAAMIVFHLKNYRIEGDWSDEALKIFLTISTAMILLIIFIFFSIDWNMLSSSDFFENFGGVSNSQY